MVLGSEVQERRAAARTWPIRATHQPDSSRSTVAERTNRCRATTETAQPGAATTTGTCGCARRTCGCSRLARVVRVAVELAAAVRAVRAIRFRSRCSRRPRTTGTASRCPWTIAFRLRSADGAASGTRSTNTDWSSPFAIRAAVMELADTATRSRPATSTATATASSSRSAHHVPHQHLHRRRCHRSPTTTTSPAGPTARRSRRGERGVGRNLTHSPPRPRPLSHEIPLRREPPNISGSQRE